MLESVIPCRLRQSATPRSELSLPSISFMKSCRISTGIQISLNHFPPPPVMSLRPVMGKFQALNLNPGCQVTHIAMIDCITFRYRCDCFGGMMKVDFRKWKEVEEVILEKEIGISQWREWGDGIPNAWAHHSAWQSSNPLSRFAGRSWIDPFHRGRLPDYYPLRFCMWTTVHPTLVDDLFPPVLFLVPIWDWFHQSLW